MRRELIHRNNKRHSNTPYHATGTVAARSCGTIGSFFSLVSLGSSGTFGMAAQRHPATAWRDGTDGTGRDGTGRTNKVFERRQPSKNKVFGSLETVKLLETIKLLESRVSLRIRFHALPHVLQWEPFKFEPTPRPPHLTPRRLLDQKSSPKEEKLN